MNRASAITWLSLWLGAAFACGSSRVNPSIVPVGDVPDAATTGADAAPPPPGAEGAVSALRFAVIGDYGFDGRNEAAVAQLVQGWNPDFVITTGDNNYPDGAASTIDANIGKYFHSFIGNYVGRYGAGSPTNRFWPTPGNHDWLFQLMPYLSYFTLPDQPAHERYYEVDYGLVHLFSLDSDPHEPDGATVDSKQAQWLRDRLAASRACFDIVYFHQPAYSSGEHGSLPRMQWPFAAWGARAVMNGHDHLYERSEVDGIPYFVCGASGNGLFTPTAAQPQSKFRYSARFGAMLVTANTSGITYEFWTAEGTLVDSTTWPARCPL